MITFYILLAMVILETTILIPTVYYLIKFSMILLRFQDAIEDCIGILDERQESISRILKIPIFYDSPEIRRVLEDIKISRESIIKVANSFGSTDIDQIGSEQINSQEKGLEG